MIMSDVVIKTEDLVHVYPHGGTRALDGVNLEINKGDVVSIIGQNGSGKTTLVRHFNGLLRPTSGKVYLMGEDTQQKNIADLSRQCGYVFQNPNHQIFCSTVRDELLVAPKNFKFTPEQAKQRLDAVVDLMGIGDILDKHPMTLDYTTKKVITIASVLIFNPEVLILDEPTGGLDEVGRRMLSKVIQLVHSEGHTVIIISHDMDYVAENSSRVVMMAKAHILSDSTPDKIFLDADLCKLAQIEPPQISSLDMAISGRQSNVCLSVEDFVKRYAR